MSLQLPIKFEILNVIEKQDFDFHNEIYKEEIKNEEISLNIIKNKINFLDKNEWVRLRHYTNPYDFPNICSEKLYVFNRAFYKFWEINHEFNLVDTKCNSSVSLHLAEAPGSFIHSLNHYYIKNKNLTVIDEDGFEKKIKFKPYKIFYDTMSLIAKNSPFYNKRIKNNNQVNIKENRNGDICCKENLLGFINSDSKYYMITADGGIDENGQFEQKEQLHYKLILCEILIALNTQEVNGNFLCKMYDIFTDTTINYIWILSLFYEKIYIYKPLTSRITNSEKYIVCLNYRGHKCLSKLNEFVIENIENDLRLTIRPGPDEEFVNDIQEKINFFVKLQEKSIDKSCDNIKFINDKQFILDSENEKVKNFNLWLEKYSL